MTGYALSEVLGESPRLLNSGVPDADFSVCVAHGSHGGSAWHRELTNRRKNGGLYTEEMAITPVRDDIGRSPTS